MTTDLIPALVHHQSIQPLVFLLQRIDSSLQIVCVALLRVLVSIRMFRGAIMRFRPSTISVVQPFSKQGFDLFLILLNRSQRLLIILLNGVRRVLMQVMQAFNESLAFLLTI
jgi:hypothetical protein